MFSVSRDGELWRSISSSVLEPTVALLLTPRVATGFTRTLDLQRSAQLTDSGLIQAVNQIRGDQEHTSLDSVQLGGEHP